MKSIVLICVILSFCLFVEATYYQGSGEKNSKEKNSKEKNSREKNSKEKNSREKNSSKEKKSVKCTGPYEVFSKCGAHGCLNTCEEPDLITRCTYEAGCYPGCICKSGYLRNEHGVCVHQSQCPPKPALECGRNEVYVECNNPCPPDNCEDVGKQFKCAAVDPETCEPACRCAKGYYRNKQNVCVLAKQCPPKCGANEIWSNSCPDCPECCDNIGKSRCKTTKPGCACAPGYVRERKGGKCVKKTSCRKY